MNEFGEYLKNIRGNRSLREMERITGISHTYLSTIEKGYDPRSKKERKPTPDVIKQLSRGLKLDYFDMMVKAGYLSQNDRNDFLSKSFFKNIIYGLTFEEKESFIKDFVNNYLQKSIHPQGTNIIKKRRETRIIEFNKDNNLQNLEENSMTEFLIKNFHLFASLGDYLKILRFHRKKSISEMATLLNISESEYIEIEEEYEQKTFLKVTEMSFQIGSILKVGDFFKWYADVYFDFLANEGIVKKVNTVGKSIGLIKDIHNENRFIFEIGFTPTKNYSELDKETKEQWREISREFFSIENLLNLSDEISIDGHVLSSEDKEKALKILKTSFNNKKTEDPQGEHYW